MSRTVQNTSDWAAPIIRFLPLTIGTGNEPAITNANIIQETIVGPPFCWDWNRATTSFNTVIGTQDYAKTVSDFGFIEKATVAPAAGDLKELTVRNALSLDTRVGRPEFIASQTDNNAGSISFRLMKIPDAVYAVNVIYQKAPAQITALANSWAVPDKYTYLCDYGFLALALLHLDDPRLGFYNQKFMSGLLSTNRGLTEMERNIFIGDWLALTRQEMGNSIKTQQAQAARGA